MKKFDWIDWQDDIKRAGDAAKTGLIWTAISTVVCFIGCVLIDWFFREKS